MAKTPRKGGDLNVTAFNTLTAFLEKNDPKPKPVSGPTVATALDSAEMRRQIMREMGRRGGQKGGKARAASLSKNERSEIAKAAAKARWKKK